MAGQLVMDQVPDLIDVYLPRYQFREYHDVKLRCSPDDAYQAIQNLDFSDSRIVRMLLKLRGLPVSDLSLKGFVEEARFTWLEERLNQEVLIGFWGNRKVEKITNKENFILNSQNKKLRLVWNFRVTEVRERVSVSTETRVHCADKSTQFIFSIYWLVIRPFSGLIRIIMLKKIAKSVAI